MPKAEKAKKPLDDAEDVDDETGDPDPEYYLPPSWLADAIDEVMDEVMDEDEAKAKPKKK